MDSLSDIPSILAATAPITGEATGTIGGLLFYISIALGISFLCSILEASLLSIPPSYVETQAQTGSRAGRLMQKHKLNVEAPITAILTLNTIAHTVGAAGAGAQAVGVFGNEFFGIISAILTFLILAFSEIIPKTLGTLYWKQLYAFTAYVIQGMIIVLYPAVLCFQAMTRLLAPDHKAITVTRAEIEMMAAIGATEGTLKENEGRVLKNLLNLGKVQVGDIMTPRTVMLAFKDDMTVGEVINQHAMLNYSRIPIYKENLDDITGFVLRYDILKRVASDQHDVPLSDLKLDLHPVPETLPVSTVLNEFMARKQHIFLVFDEYSGTSGIVTMEDAVESLLGIEITDESDLVADMRKLAEQRYTRQYALLNPVVPSSTNGGSAGTYAKVSMNNRTNGATPDTTSAESA
ncbi:MAG: hemolysin family protein [Aggregatilineales bacterium]